MSSVAVATAVSSTLRSGPAAVSPLAAAAASSISRSLHASLREPIAPFFFRRPFSEATHRHRSQTHRAHAKSAAEAASAAGFKPAVVMPDRLEELVHRIVAAAGSNEDEAATVAANLVLSNLKGHDSHGVGYLPGYIRSAAAGRLVVNQRLKVIAENPSMLVLDADHGYGQVMGKQAMERAVSQARETGVCCVSLRNSYHLGRIGAWAEMAADAGLMSIHLVNVHGHDPLVAAHHGADARLGTNPVAIAFPPATQANGTVTPPIVLDYATSARSLGKVREAMGRGDRVEEGVVLDALGQETTDPTAMFVDPIGALLPFAGHKGYAMCLMAELLGGVATGGRTIAPEHPRVEGAIYNSMLALVIDPAKTTGGLDPDSIATEAGYVADHVKASAPRAGHGPVKLPGEVEDETVRVRTQHGIPVSAGTWEDLRSVASTAAGIDSAEFDAYRLPEGDGP